MEAGKRYEVYKEYANASPIRLGSLGKPHLAIEIMNRMAARMPGKYFVIDTLTAEVIARCPSSSDNIEIVKSTNSAAVSPSDAPFVATRSEQTDRIGPMKSGETNTARTISNHRLRIPRS
jgi:hypothetical protein